MDGLNKTNCAFALDGVCKLPDNACKRCKVDMETSEFHKTIICGLTWDELMKMQRVEYRNKSRTVCHECAEKAGYKPKNKVVGVWVDECEICHRQKPCTDLVHDWKYEKSKIANQESPNQESPSVMIEDRE